MTPYWTSNLRIVGVLLTIWFVVSFLLSIAFVDALDSVRIGGFRLGFWMAQQGSLYVYVLLLVAYLCLMDRLDQRHRLKNQGAPDETGS